jgi:hypothetical protein
MSSLVGMVLAFVLGLAVAGGAAVGIVQLAQQTADNTASVDRPLIEYGDR